MPDLQENFLGQILAIVGRVGVGAGDSQDSAAMLHEPMLKLRLAVVVGQVVVKQVAVPLPDVLVAGVGRNLQGSGQVNEARGAP